MSRLVAERESELSTIWGSHVVKSNARGWGDEPAPASGAATNMGGSDPTALRVPRIAKRRMAGNDSDDELANSDDDKIKPTKKGVKKGKDDKTAAKAAKDAKKKAQRDQYKLHCFIAPGTTKNEIRELFEDYEPKVDVRVSQKGNVLNKTHFCVLTFSNRAMALHAVQRFQGTDQMNTIGSRSVQLSVMRSRRQNKNRITSRRPANVRRRMEAAAKAAAK